MQRHLPAEPLLKFVEGRVTTYHDYDQLGQASAIRRDMAKAMGITTGTISRIRTRGYVHWLTADEICVRLGVNAPEIWPVEWCATEDQPA